MWFVIIVSDYYSSISFYIPMNILHSTLCVTSYVQCFILHLMFYMPCSIYYIPRSTFNIPLFVRNISRPTYSIFTWRIPYPIFCIPHFTFPAVLSHILFPTYMFHLRRSTSHILYPTSHSIFHDETLITYPICRNLMHYVSYPIFYILHFVIFPIRTRKRNQKMPTEHRIQAIIIP